MIIGINQWDDYILIECDCGHSNLSSSSSSKYTLNGIEYFYYYCDHCCEKIVMVDTICYKHTINPKFKNDVMGRDETKLYLAVEDLVG